MTSSTSAGRQRLIASVAVVAGGTAAAQVVNFFGFLLATYFLTPTDFGHFGAHIAISAPLAIIATGRYEAALIKANSPSSVVNLVGLCLLLSVTTGLLASLALLLLKAYVGGLQDIWISIVFALLFFQALLNSVIQLNNANRNYSLIAFSRLSGAVAAQAALLLLAMKGLGGAALGYGLAFGMLVSVAISVMGNRQWLMRFAPRVSFRRMRALARRYFSYTVFNGPQALASAFQETAAIAVITVFFGQAATGLYVLANRLMKAPIAIVAESLGRVLQRHFADLPPTALELRKRTFVRYLAASAGLGAAVTVIAWIAGPVAVQLFFEAEWSGLAGFIRAGALYYGSYLIGSALVLLPLATGDHKPVAALGIAGSVLYVVSIAIGGTLTTDLTSAFYGVSAAMTVYFITLVALIYHATIGRKQRIPL